jgi:hypothetical protein
LNLRSYFGDLARAIELAAAIIADRVVLWALDRIDAGPGAFVEPTKEPLAAVIAIAFVLMVKVRIFARPVVTATWYRGKVPVQGELLTLGRSVGKVSVTLASGRGGRVGRWVLAGRTSIPLELTVLPAGSFNIEVDSSYPTGNCDDANPSSLLIAMPLRREGDRQDVNLVLSRQGTGLAQPAEVRLGVAPSAPRRLRRFAAVSTQVNALQ